MTENSETRAAAAAWTARLAPYRTASWRRATFELAVTLIPFLALWALALWALSVNPWLSFGVAVLNSGLLVRLFMIQHDCGHGAFFPARTANDWLGRMLGVLTLTPYAAWKRTHAMHHATTGNLDRRGVGDLPTLTLAEYRARGPLRRFGYRLLRNPLFLFGVVPAYVFLVQYRLPANLYRAGWRYWASALGTNLFIAGVVGTLVWGFGWAAILAIYLPTSVVAGAAGFWLFFVQHQFEETLWEREADWTVQEAALHGSSYYVLPAPLRWLTANIGMHHIHHLAARTPFYRLPQILREHPELDACQRLTLRESLRCARLHLWDEERRLLVPFAAVRQTA